MDWAVQNVTRAGRHGQTVASLLLLTTALSPTDYFCRRICTSGLLMGGEGFRDWNRLPGGSRTKTVECAQANVYVRIYNVVLLTVWCTIYTVYHLAFKYRFWKLRNKWYAVSLCLCVTRLEGGFSLWTPLHLSVDQMYICVDRSSQLGWAL